MRGWAAGLLSLVLCTSVRAQTATLEPSAALACLTPAADVRGEPAYPIELYKRGVGGSVKIAVDFPGGLFGPDIEVLERVGEDAFVGAVRQHAGRLRVPCLAPGEKARLLFEFSFRPASQTVSASEPLDAADAARRKMVGCIVPIGAGASPVYPIWASRRGLQGRLLASVQFAAADQPPTWRLHHRPAANELADAVERWLAALRMPCHEGGPVRLTQQFIFVMEGSGYGFKPLTLQQFVGSVRNIRQQRLQFDTTQMGCPFDIKLEYRQPYLKNRVATTGAPHDSHAYRRPLLTWLAESPLDLPARSLDAVYADTVDIQVPCLKIDLDPSKEPSK